MHGVQKGSVLIIVTPHLLLQGDGFSKFSIIGGLEKNVRNGGGQGMGSGGCEFGIEGLMVFRNLVLFYFFKDK